MKSQDYQVALSFGYLYIVILGILKEAFYYSQIGIDYFKYCSITDILISPISDIAYSIIRIVVFVSLVILTWLLPAWLVSHKDKSWIQKGFGVDPQKPVKDIQKQLSQMCVVMLCLGLMGFYVGRGIGTGAKISEQMKSQKITYEDQLSFMNNDVDTVKLVGKNSSFLFYIPKDKTAVEITPINNVKRIFEKR